MTTTQQQPKIIGCPKCRKGFFVGFASHARGPQQEFMCMKCQLVITVADVPLGDNDLLMLASLNLENLPALQALKEATGVEPVTLGILRWEDRTQVTDDDITAWLATADKEKN